MGFWEGSTRDELTGLDCVSIPDVCLSCSHTMFLENDCTLRCSSDRKMLVRVLHSGLVLAPLYGSWFSMRPLGYKPLSWNGLRTEHIGTLFLSYMPGEMYPSIEKK